MQQAAGKLNPKGGIEGKFMNIGIVTTWFERGAAYVSRQFADILSERHDVFIYGRGGESRDSNSVEWLKYPVTWDPIVWSPMRTDMKKEAFVNWVCSNHIDIVVFNEQHYFEPVIWCSELQVKTVAYIDYYTKKSIKLFSAYDLLICNTNRHFSVFNSICPAVYVPWGTDTDLFSPSSIDHVLQLKKRYGVDLSKTIVFHSAGMNPYRKGTDVVIDLCHKLKEESVQFVVHTQVDLFSLNYMEIGKTKSLIECGQLVLVHETVTAPGLYCLGDFYLYPTRLEGIGLTIAEALSCGLPVITTDEAPMNEFVDEEVGVLVNTISSRKRMDGYYWPEVMVSTSELETAVKSFLDSNRLKKTAIKARKHAQEKLDWRANSSNLSNVLTNVVLRPLENDIKQMIISYHSKQLPYFSKIPWFYRMLGRIYKLFKNG